MQTNSPLGSLKAFYRDCILQLLGILIFEFLRVLTALLMYILPSRSHVMYFLVVWRSGETFTDQSLPTDTSLKDEHSIHTYSRNVKKKLLSLKHCSQICKKINLFEVLMRQEELNHSRCIHTHYIHRSKWGWSKPFLFICIKERKFSAFAPWYIDIAQSQGEF